MTDFFLFLIDCFLQMKSSQSNQTWRRNREKMDKKKKSLSTATLVTPKLDDSPSKAGQLELTYDELIGLVPSLNSCANCGKKEAKSGEFQPCERCRVVYCSKDCQSTTHRQDHGATCKAIGSKIAQAQIWFNKCTQGVCGAQFTRHCAGGRCYTDFPSCSACLARSLSA